MALIYKIYEKKNRLGDGKKIQVATQVNKGTVSIRQIADRLEQITSLGRGDVMNVLTHLGEVVAEHVREGYSVKLHELGTFTPRIQSTSVPAGEPFRSTHIKGVKMRYTPSTYLKAELAQAKFTCEADTCKAPTGGSTTPPKEDPDGDTEI